MADNERQFDVNLEDIIFALVASIILVLFLFIFRFFFNWLVIDVCILGDYSLCKRLFCRGSMDESNGQASSRINDGLIASDPVAYIANLPEGARRGFIDVAISTEITLIVDSTLDCSRFGEETDCSICLENLSEKSSVKTKICSHYFHESCLTEWLQNNMSCPYCRTQFLTNEKLKDMLLSMHANDDEAA